MIFNKCDINFNTQWVYINNIWIHINNYDKKKYDIPKCMNGHELIFCNGNNKQKYFRHKNKYDIKQNNEKSEWHKEWQGFFKYTEIPFEKINEKQIKKRIADVVLENSNYILEIQHSNITEDEVKNRKEDYLLHNKEIIWIIDGNNLLYEELNDNTYIITFNNEWMYKSFLINYEFILLDINNKIFKIKLDKIFMKMICVNEYIEINIIINELSNNPKNIWNLWKNNYKISKIKRIQRGAGNGKTYGIWKSIIENPNKKLFIIIVKEHTAKEVIKNELYTQYDRNEYHLENIIELDCEIYGKQYKITYKHNNTKKEYKVIIGTVDSFIYSLNNQNIGGNNYFIGLLDFIIKNGFTKLNIKTGQILYGGEKIKLNKEAELWVDESQDLNIKYYIVFVKLISITNMDIVVVGDKLQSLTYEENLMSYNDIENIINEPVININKRIKSKRMAELINKLINFKKYNIPEITIENEELLEDRENVIEIIKQQEFFPDEKNKNKVENFADKLIQKVNDEVIKYKYLPKDFLFIFPIMKNNRLAIELETKLNEYWIKYFNNNDKEYKQYAILHKHEEGTVIDTSLSVEATRIMSIKASKGDGRNVIFILNTTEKAIKLFSSNEINIIYESFIHVALTRAKYKIYFGLQENNDDIHKRFFENKNELNYIEDVSYQPNIKVSFNIDKLMQYINKDNFINLIEKNNFKYEFKEEENNLNEIIDWDYHCIRRNIYYNYIIFYCLNNLKINIKSSQIYTVLDKLFKLPILRKNPKNFYNYLNQLEKDKNLEYFPLCDLSSKDIYNNYYNYIEKIINYIKNIYEKNFLNLINLEPLEACILIFMIDTYINKKHITYSPCMLYNIIHYFKLNNNKITYLMNESQNIKVVIENVITNIKNHNNNKEIKWNIEHPVFYKHNFDENLCIYNKYNIIGNTEKYIYHFIFQTDFNKLNYNNTIIKILLERFLLRNCKENSNNFDRFNNKKIITYLLILKKNKYEIFDFDFENNINKELKNLLKDALIKYFNNYNKELFYYLKYVKSDKNKWKNFTSPYLFIKKKYDEVNYINNMFSYFHEESKKTREKIKEITDNEEYFLTIIKTYIEEMCDIFLNLNNIQDDDEW